MLNEWSSNTFISNSSQKLHTSKAQIPLNVVILNLTDDFTSKGGWHHDIPLARIVRYSKKKVTRIRDVNAYVPHVRISRQSSIIIPGKTES